MGTGILMCGLNGAGKSTLGRALARELSFHFIDNEELYFPSVDSDYIYASPRQREEAEKLLFRELGEHENFVFACVKGDYGERLKPFLSCAVLLNVPRDVRMQRVRDRSFRKFGGRILPGGDLHEREERFFHSVGSRADDTVEEWVRSLKCPVIRADGTRPIEENVSFLTRQIQEIGQVHRFHCTGDHCRADTE